MNSIESRIDERDRAGRERAVDPRFNVALEASAGTGKTRVLVDRYINLLRAGVDPANILAITFTRKAAAEMRDRIVASLRTAAARGEISAARWRELRDRTADIAISTIDAFCLSLLREFPLEADVDPAFAMADDTEVPRLIEESLDRALRTCRVLARDDENVALVFAQLGNRRARSGLAALLNRRVVAPAVLAKYLASASRELSVETTARRGATALLEIFDGMRGGLQSFVATGPSDPGFALLVRHVERLQEASCSAADVQAAFARARDYFLTHDGEPRSRLLHAKAAFRSEPAWRMHRDLVVAHAPEIARTLAAHRRDLNVIVSRGVMRMFKVAETEYRRALEAHAVLDFSDVLLRALDLLRQMEEFAQSRYRLESRYHHVLVDEFQDTSRAQWELISLLVQSWGEGAGLAHSGPLPPSIFIVGDRKQSIYSFRDADVSVLQEAARYLGTLRPDGDVRRSISRSFRSVPALLAFVNDVFHDVPKVDSRRDAFDYAEEDRFPVDPLTHDAAHDEPLGLVLAHTAERAADLAAAEIDRLIATGATVRDRESGVRRAVRPGDIAILFRTRESHREFEDALERRGIASYVYKGLGFFDADEIKDILALLAYLAEPDSDPRAAAWLRSRFVKLSDEGLRRLAPHLADALRGGDFSLDEHDARALARARVAVAEWLPLVDRIPPAELLDRVLRDAAYAVEVRGRRMAQARENLKKIRALVRRVQNRGYATLGHLVAHLDRLAVGDEANAAIDALDAVNLMTVHAAKGLEFPIVFVVHLTRGTASRRDPIRVVSHDDGAAASVAVGDFQSDADEAEEVREREETKRLLYVAVTRARDRLYLGAVSRDGRLQPARGSLAEVLPARLRDSMDEAAIRPWAEWRATSGATHRFRVCADLDAMPDAANAAVMSLDEGDELCDFAPIDDTGPARMSVAEAAVSASGGVLLHSSAASDRLLGLLVHRLLQRIGVAADLTPRSIADLVPRLLRGDEIADARDRETLADEVAAAYLALTRQPDVAALYASGDAFHEVPFTMRVDGTLLRGAIDCVVRSQSRALTILEFKTGRPRPEHDAQTALYRRALAETFPEATVEARIVYVEGPAACP